jgi:hypothetical protein
VIESKAMSNEQRAMSEALTTDLPAYWRTRRTDT